jgi:hypothetical protein
MAALPSLARAGDHSREHDHARRRLTDPTSPPFPLDASAGTEAHVDVRLRSHGDNAWRQEQLACTVWSSELSGFAGTIDTVVNKALTFARL